MNSNKLRFHFSLSAEQILKTVIIAFAVLVPTGAAAYGLGPFHLPAVGFSEMFRETPMFVCPGDHEEGRIRFNVAVRWFNVWAFHVEADEPYDWKTNPESFPFKHGSFLLDMETVSFIPRISVKVSEKCRVEASIPVIYQCGGILDGLIEGFHNTLGISQHKRDKWERNGTSMLYVSKKEEIIDVSNEVPGTYLGNIVLGGSFCLTDADPSMGFRLLCKLPTSNMGDRWEQKGVDVTFQTTLAWHRSQISGYHGIGATYYGSRGRVELGLKRQRYAMLNAMEVSITPSFSILAHLVTASSTADYPELDNPVIELTLGFKKLIGQGVLEFGVIENLFFYDNSPDIGVHLAYSFSML